MSYIGNSPANVPIGPESIADGSITLAKLSVNSVDSSKIVVGGVDLSSTDVTGVLSVAKGGTGGSNGAQEPLVSGTNIKSVNGNSLIGSGNIDAGGNFIRSARTSNTILGVSDKTTFIDITSGTFTQTFSPVATLSSGWFVYIRNSGTGDITLDPNGLELIDGLVSYIMYPGETRLIQCDGAVLTSVVINSFYKTFTTSGNFIKPPGYQQFGGLLWGGGSSGAWDNGSSGGPPGGGGGMCFPITAQYSDLLSSEPVVIGAGGTKNTVISPLFNNGGNSTFATKFIAYGALGNIGGRPIGAVYTNNGPTPALSVYGWIYIGTSDGYAANTILISVYGGSNSNASSSQNNQKSQYGGGGGGQGNGSTTAGISIIGGSGGVGGTNASPAGDGIAPGGGGGGYMFTTGTNLGSGAGARGELRIWGVI